VGSFYFRLSTTSGPKERGRGDGSWVLLLGCNVQIELVQNIYDMRERKFVNYSELHVHTLNVLHIFFGWGQQSGELRITCLLPNNSP